MDTPAAHAFVALCSAARAVFARHHADGDHAYLVSVDGLGLPYFDLMLHQDDTVAIVPSRRNEVTRQNISYTLEGGHTALALRHAIAQVLITAGDVAPAVLHPDHPLQSRLRLRFRPALAKTEDGAMPEGSYLLNLPGVQATYDALEARQTDDLSWRLHVLSQVRSLDTPRRYQLNITAPTAGPSRVTVLAADAHDACLRAIASTGATFARHLAEGHVQVLAHQDMPQEAVAHALAHASARCALPIF